MSKTVVYLQENMTDYSVYRARLARELDLHFSPVSTISYLTLILGTPTCKVDVILVDLNFLYSLQGGTTGFELLNTLTTLSKFTAYQEVACEPVDRDVKIAVLVDEDSSIELLRDFLGLPGNCGFIHCGGNADYHELRTALTDIVEGRVHIPRIIKEKLYPKPIRGTKPSISLTPREQQVLSLIRDRGASNKIIAKMLDISESTVKLHIGKVLKKYGAKNRTQLAVFSRSA